VSRRVKIETFTIFEAGSNQIFLEIGPRSNPPQDDTAVLRVGHKTVDSGGISVLLERSEFGLLMADLLATDRTGPFGGLQTSAIFYPASGPGLQPALAIWWNGSGRSRTFTFSPDQVSEMVTWMRDRIDHGWTGWKSGVKSE